jgi:hypothetical protein
MVAGAHRDAGARRGQDRDVENPDKRPASRGRPVGRSPHAKGVEFGRRKWYDTSACKEGDPTIRVCADEPLPDPLAGCLRGYRAGDTKGLGLLGTSRACAIGWISSPTRV